MQTMGTTYQIVMRGSVFYSTTCIGKALAAANAWADRGHEPEIKVVQEHYIDRQTWRETND